LNKINLFVFHKNKLWKIWTKW